MKTSLTLERVARMLARLPGIGERSAMRYALFLLRSDDQLVLELSRGLRELKERVRLCATCCALTELAECGFCTDPQRNTRVVCVVEDISDLVAIERASPANWMYHVLHGALSPLDGVTPNDLKIRELLQRLQDHAVEEVILATNASVEGEATAVYLAKLLAPLRVKVSRIAQGIPLGSQLEYVDQATLGRALADRQTLPQMPQKDHVHVPY